MYLGNLVELCDAEALFDEACHPYTKALLSAMPIADPDDNEKQKRVILEGDVPSPAEEREGCPFAGRCSKCMEICKKIKPEAKKYKEGHLVACHLYK